jgi:hypothetical protein
VFSAFVAAALLVAAFFGASPIFERNAFSRDLLELERARSYVRWSDGIDFLNENLPANSVIASDPVTSYSIPAVTSYHTVCTLDQHGPPNDARLEERIQAAREMLSPYVPVGRTIELMSEHRATHVVLNNRFPARMLQHYWSMDPGIFPDCKRKFLEHPELFEVLYNDNGFIVLRRTNTFQPSGMKIANPFVLDGVPADFTVLGNEAGEAVLEAFKMPRAAERGGKIDVGLVWSSNRDNRAGNYMVSVRFDHTNPGLPFDGKPFPKITRKIVEMLRGHRYRFRLNHKIRNGFLSPDGWQPGDLVLDETMIRVPYDIAPGVYTVSAKLLTVPQQPNYHVRDILYDSDIYQGIPMGEITVE